MGGWSTGAGTRFLTYLKFGDIKGEVKVPAYRSWIELISASHNQKEITCIKEPDTTSGKLWQYGASGETADAVIDFVRESGGVYFRLVMSDARITSIQYGNDREGFSIHSAKITSKHEPGTPPP